MDDFNTIRYQDEHRGGFLTHYSRNNLIAYNPLFDIGYVCYDFTWCNGQLGLAHRWAMLNRYLSNS